MPTDVVAALLLSLALLAEALAVLGVLLMPHLFDRLHFLSLASSVGPPLVAGAVLAKEALAHQGLVTVLVALVLVVLSPVVTHATARAARIRSLGDWRPGQDETVHRP